MNNYNEIFIIIIKVLFITKCFIYNFKKISIIIVKCIIYNYKKISTVIIKCIILIVISVLSTFINRYS